MEYFNVLLCVGLKYSVFFVWYVMGCFLVLFVSKIM